MLVSLERGDGREIGRLRHARHIGVAGGIDSDRIALVCVRTFQVGGVYECRSIGADFGDERVAVISSAGGLLRIPRWEILGGGESCYIRVAGGIGDYSVYAGRVARRSAPEMCGIRQDGIDDQRPATIPRPLRSGLKLRPSLPPHSRPRDDAHQCVGCDWIV